LSLAAKIRHGVHPMSAKKVLIVEDEEDILKLLEINLRKHDYSVTGVMSGEKALETIQNDNFDLVLLDLMLPGIDGIQVCKTIKSNPLTKELPVIMLTARGEEGDIIKGFECGADDYVTKPFSLKVLMARVKTALRRTESATYNKDSVINVHNLRIDPQKHEVLTPTTCASTRRSTRFCWAKSPSDLHPRNSRYCTCSRPSRAGY
jgi:two-component system, OmpR family, alkaline phosphatase synthesis response regulator PhoP